MHGEGTRATKLRKRDHKSTRIPELPIHLSLKGEYAILMGCAVNEGAVAVP